MTDDSRTSAGAMAALRDGARQAIDYDDHRPSLPYEHVGTLAAGAAFILCALMVPRRAAAVCHAALGGALLLRAASGRDGLRKWSDAPRARPSLDGYSDAA